MKAHERLEANIAEAKKNNVFDQDKFNEAQRGIERVKEAQVKAAEAIELHKTKTPTRDLTK